MFVLLNSEALSKDFSSVGEEVHELKLIDETQVFFRLFYGKTEWTFYQGHYQYKHICKAG